MRVAPLRLQPDEYQQVTERAHREDLAVSHLLRRMVQYGLANMPDYWVPPSRTRDLAKTAQQQKGRRS